MDLSCEGVENNITECSYRFARSVYRPRCLAHETDVSVLCQTGIISIVTMHPPLLACFYTVCPDSQFMCSNGRTDGQQPACISPEQRCDGVTDCAEGEDELESNCPCSPEGTVRLVDGIVSHRGRVEICRNSRWSTMCTADRDFSTVLCRQLGFPSEGIAIWKLQRAENFSHSQMLSFLCKKNMYSKFQMQLLFNVVRDLVPGLSHSPSLVVDTYATADRMILANVYS